MLPQNILGLFFPHFYFQLILFVKPQNNVSCKAREKAVSYLSCPSAQIDQRLALELTVAAKQHYQLLWIL